MVKHLDYKTYFKFALAILNPSKKLKLRAPSIFKLLL